MKENVNEFINIFSLNFKFGSISLYLIPFFILWFNNLYKFYYIF